MSPEAATKTRARGWERKRANHDTYEETLEAAAQAFSKNGYDGTSLTIDDLASEYADHVLASVNGQ
jgi:hypothetical protein